MKLHKSKLEYLINKPVRKHGFQFPLHPNQVISWVIFTEKIFIFVFLLYQPMDEGIHKDLTITTFSLMTTFLFLLAAWVTYKDPTDENVEIERRAKLKEFLLISKVSEVYVPTSRHFCTVCDAHVNRNSKHCSQCNRCVKDFDHHCKWLNTCIGKKNYSLIWFNESSFFILLISTTIHFGYCMIYSIMRLEGIANGDENEAQFFSKLPIGVKGQQIILVIFACQEGFIMFVVINLLLFHIYLSLKGFTTYDFIVLRRERLKKKRNNGKRDLSPSDLCSEDVVDNNRNNNESCHTDEEAKGSDNSKRENKYKDKRLVVNKQGKSKVGIKLSTQKASSSSLPDSKSTIQQIKSKYKAKYKEIYKEKYLQKLKKLKNSSQIQNLNLNQNLQSEESKEQFPSAPQTLEKNKPRTLEARKYQISIPKKLYSDNILRKKGTLEHKETPLYTATSGNGNLAEIESLGEFNNQNEDHEQNLE